MSRSLLSLLAASAVLATTGTAFAQNGQRAPVIAADPDRPWQTTGHFSWRLGARFEIQTMQIPGYVFQAARIVSEPVSGSPLHQLSLRVGDVITRLDGTPVTYYARLDGHHRLTQVRYIKAGSTLPQNGWIRIPRYHRFQEHQVFYPPPGNPLGNVPVAP